MLNKAAVLTSFSVYCGSSGRTESCMFFLVHRNAENVTIGPLSGALRVEARAVWRDDDARGQQSSLCCTGPALHS